MNEWMCSTRSRCVSCTCEWLTRVRCASRRRTARRRAASSAPCRSTSSPSTSRRSSGDVRTTPRSRRTPGTVTRRRRRRRPSTCSSASTSVPATTTTPTPADSASSYRTNHRRVPESVFSNTKCVVGNCERGNRNLPHVQSILRKIFKIVAARCHRLRLKCTKFYFSWGSAQAPAGGAYVAPQTP